MTTLFLSRVPPSQHRLWKRNRATGRMFKAQDYISWIRLSQAEIMLQRPHKWREPVDILIRIPRGQVKKASDASNRIKAPEDLLVTMGIVADDSSTYVRRSGAEFADIEQTQIVITPVNTDEVA